MQVPSGGISPTLAARGFGFARMLRVSFRATSLTSKKSGPSASADAAPALSANANAATGSQIASRMVVLSE